MIKADVCGQFGRVDLVVERFLFNVRVKLPQSPLENALKNSLGIRENDQIDPTNSDTG